ncbi:hypothetical protein BDR26DRAFT_291989 [Obelidium mucronatum]|nr:hypothetical protein BDR26DRAFT_291989 [Obelidium mucronatum]
MISFFRRKLRGSSSEEVTAPLPGRMDQAKPTTDVAITGIDTAIYSTNLEPSKTVTLEVNIPGSSPDIMESLVNSKHLDELSHLSRQFITLFTKTLSVSSETAIVLNHIESGLSFADLTSQLSHLDSLFSACEVTPIAGSVSDIAHDILNGIEAIADSHPLVKITWFIASAGYQLAKATNEIDKGFEALARRFLNASTEITRLKSIKTKGIPLETQSSPL